MIDDQVVEKSGQYFNSGYYCGESVLLAVANHQGIQSDLIPRMATGFCSGMARTAGMCGAVAGGVLAINLVLGRQSNRQPVDQNYQAVQRFVRDFTRAFGSIQCPDLIGCDLATTQGQAYFKDKRLKKKCQGITREATRLVLTVLSN